MSGSIQQSFHFNSKESQLIQRECVLITSEYSLKGIICSYCVAAKKIKVWFWCKIKKTGYKCVLSRSARLYQVLDILRLYLNN